MRHLFASYEIAKQLKEKGFDEECLAYFNGDEPHIIPTRGTVPVSKINIHRNTFLHDIKSNLVLTPEENFSQEWIDKRGEVTRSKWGIKVAAPLYQQVIDWFRDIHNLYINVMPLRWATNNIECFTWTMRDFNKAGYFDSGNEYFTYKLALNAGIEKALKLI